MCPDISGIAIFLFGNKLDKDKNVILADGVKKEFEIAIKNGVIPLPISVTGYMAKEIYDEMAKDLNSFFPDNPELIPALEEIAGLGADKTEEIIDKIINLIKRVNK